MAYIINMKFVFHILWRNSNSKYRIENIFQAIDEKSLGSYQRNSECRSKRPKE